jgi:electron transport complex protein RnfB
MMSDLMPLLLLPALMHCIVLLLRLAQCRLHSDDTELVDAVDALLPQTQCAQCGYPGCRPYADAVVGGARLDLCPPGGAPVQAAMEKLLGRDAGDRLPTPAPVRAVIDESQCIGCFLCIDACPVDAIAGAPQWLHTVIEDRCTGCELCLDPCPVDCISLISAQDKPWLGNQPPTTQTDSEDACIRCGLCRPVCPEDLNPDLLWWTSRSELPGSAVQHGLDDCIECALCNQVCPSGIDLAATFSSAKNKLRTRDTLEQEAARARALFEDREDRLARTAVIVSDRRSARLRSEQRQW